MQNKPVLPVSIIQIVFKYLPLSDKMRLLICGTTGIRNLILSCSATANPDDVCAFVNQLLAKCRIIDSERVLRWVITMSTGPTSIKCIEVYLRIAQSSICRSPKLYSTYQEAFNSFIAKSKKECYNVYELKLCVNTGASVLQPRKTISTESIREISRFLTGERQINHQTCGSPFNLGTIQPVQADIPAVEQMGPRAAVEQMGPRAAVEQMGPRAAVEGSVNSGATFLLAYFLYKNAQVDASLKLIVQIESRNLQNPLTAWLRALICHYHTHEFDQAVSLYLTAIRRSPDFAYPYYSLGTLLNECGPGYILYANLLYSKCMQIDPNNHCALLNTAVIESNNIEKISTLYRVIAIYPTETYTWHVLIRAILSRKPLLESDKIEVLELQKKLNKVIEY